MKKLLHTGLGLWIGLVLVSCADTESTRKVVGPQSDTSSIPWNMPISGQGQGQFGMMQQNQMRR